jgi:effector-binding domain-containing protein
MKLVRTRRFSPNHPLMKCLPVFICAVTTALVTATAADSDVVTQVRMKELSEREYLCAKKELQIAEIGEFATSTIPQLLEKAAQMKLVHTGPIMITYFNFFGDPEQKFTAEIGVPIQAKDAKSEGPFYVRKVAKLKCASAIFQGPFNKKGDAWHTFAQAAMAKGEPTGESRELYLYWESADSPNNIVELQMGLK